MEGLADMPCLVWVHSTMYGGGCEAPPKFPFRNEGSITLAAGCAVKNSLRLSASFRFTSVEESSLTQCLPYPLPGEANIQSGGAIKVLPPGYANSPWPLSQYSKESWAHWTSYRCRTSHQWQPANSTRRVQGRRTLKALVKCMHSRGRGIKHKNSEVQHSF